jgi:predicted DsbA family dithiol-disulfide isomerase
MADVSITEFTDPACPFAWSAEPFRWRLRWLYGDHAEWKVAMVGLAEDGAEYDAKGLTTAMIARGSEMLAAQHGMPIDTSERPRMAGTVPACRAVVAARVHRDEAASEALLRELRVHHFAGALLDEPETIAAAARAAGLDPAEVAEWSADPAVEEELRAEMDAARHPMPAALVLDARLADWEGGRRYTCPSFEVTRTADGAQIAIPGFQPFAAYDVAFANLLPDVARRPAPSSVEEVLGWAGVPLATREVAEVCEISTDDARAALESVATERTLGTDSLWSLAA